MWNHNVVEMLLCYEEVEYGGTAGAGVQLVRRGGREALRRLSPGSVLRPGSPAPRLAQAQATL